MKIQALLAVACAGLLAAPGFAAAADAQPSASQPAQVKPMRQPIPLSLGRVAKVLGQPGVYLYDCNPEDIYSQSHIKGAIHTNVENWWNLLPEDKENSYVILYCINRMCTVSYEAALVAIEKGYRNVYVMPDGIQGWVSNGYEFEGTGRQDRGLEEARRAREARNK